MEELIQLDSYPVQTTLRLLLQDKTTKKNIIWATDSYASFGEAYTDRSQMTENQLRNMNYGMIQPRISKEAYLIGNGPATRYIIRETSDEKITQLQIALDNLKTKK